MTCFEGRRLYRNRLRRFVGNYDEMIGPAGGPWRRQMASVGVDVELCKRMFQIPY